MSTALPAGSRAAPPRYLTKSRFKLALECPTKLFYTGKADYQNNSLDDSFLQALAEGGFQVGALACLMYPGGTEVLDRDHASQLETTRELLQQADVTIYEAALEANGLFVRVDILRKRGDVIELIEVKAKSYDPVKNGDFLNARGQLETGMLPYLQDVAFQRHVAALAYPQFKYRAFLMLADKSARSTVDGLNQRFRIRRDGHGARIEVAPGTAISELGAPLLRAVPVDSQVDQILSGELVVAGKRDSFAQTVARLASAYRVGERIATQPGPQCAACEFRTGEHPGGRAPRSGFHECWSDAFGWKADDFGGGTVLDIWNFRKKKDLMARGVLKPRDVTQEDLSLDDPHPGPEGLSIAQRQWFQCSGKWPGNDSHYIDTAGLGTAMRQWVYPLHFIDFETCAVAIPFSRGQQPYQTTAFQFSHHVLQRDGRVEHRTQFLEAGPGVQPGVPFLRALRAALGSDNGTIFRWATHENSVLGQLVAQLEHATPPPGDAAELKAFVESITNRKVDGRVVAGPRDMVDLCALAQRHYYHPSTKGSSSLKKVLPALMQSSAHLRALYSQPVYGGTSAIRSLNHKEPVAWWAQRDGIVVDPYEMLPPVFAEFSEAERTGYEDASMSELRAGGSAMAAYGRLQFVDIDERERQAIEQALLRYCELDTLAMVMAVQAWQAWVIEAGHSEAGH
ncbi:DUF2779 domain-containing protein [Variovorax sp. RTB1]|uniref:DUF2779 domain-containing protein n=1 Tax=Variovorax sp. RTB1 TaxID=3048631 RepID=UPI002B2325DA|nr:DUF2779 domain-containing protein [Variovorax sp. RTB1]MEB0114468.1 DUF2779 domain-containing protein [Variovorax sp. RTB1]